MVEDHTTIVTYACDKCELQVDALDTATVWCPKGHLMVAQD